MPKNCHAGPMFPPNTVLPLQPERGESFPVVIRPDCTRPPTTVLPVLPDYRPAPTTLRKHVEDFGDPHHTMDLVRPHVETVTRAVESRVEALEAKSELDPQFGAWKTDVLPGLLAGKADSSVEERVDELERKSELDPQFGAWKTDVLPGLLAGKVDAALVDVRGLGTDKRVALGEGADASGGTERPVRAVAVGFDAKATGPVSTAVGGETRATADSSAAFGSGAESTAPGAVQLGSGVNTTERSLQFRGANLFKVEASATSVAILGAGFPKASKTVFGAMKAGDNLSVADGVVSAVVPTKTSQLDNDSNFASDVLARACVHTYNDPNVPPMAGVRLSADEWMFPYASIGQDPDLRLRFYPDAGEWKIGFVDGSGNFNQFSYTLHAGPDAAELDFGAADGAVTFSGADDRVVRESRLPKRTSQLENDSGFVTSVPTKTSQLENDSGFLTSVPTGADIKTSEDDEESLADKIVTLGTVVGEKQDALTDAQKAVLNGGPYVGAIGPQRIDSDGAGASLTIEGDSSNGGAVFIRGGGYNGAFLSVEDGGSTPASIKKGGKEVATEEQVNAVSGKVDEIKSTVSTDNRLLVDGTTAAIQTRESEDAEWTNEIRVDKGYDAVKLDDDATETVSLDKSVQTVRTHAANLVIGIPQSVDGTVRDFCVYVFNQNSAGGTATAITASSEISVFQDENDSVKWNAACPAGGQIAVYLTAIPDASGKVFRAARSVLKRAEDIA